MLLWGVMPPCDYFSSLWQVAPLFGPPDHAESAPTGRLDREQSLSSPSPGSVILDEVIDPRQSVPGFGLGTDQLSVVRAQPFGQAGRGAR